MSERSKDWLEQAERDLERARLDLRYAYYEWACFVAQQVAEKALKGLHSGANRSVRGHGVLGLLQAYFDIEPSTQSEDLRHCARILDRYYITARYPNGFPLGKPADYFDEQLAQEAIDAAEKILRFCRSRLTGPGTTAG